MSAIDQINKGGTIYEIVTEIAELFSTTKTYHTGDHVIYEAGWYTFKADKSAGAWDATKVNGPFKVSEQLTDLKSELTQKANTDGYYADLVSGGSTQLLSDMVETDTTPYNYRTAGGSLEIGDRMKLKKIVGGTVAWNQMVAHGNFDSDSFWYTYNCTFAIENGIATITPTATPCRLYEIASVVLGHKYLMMASFKGASGGGTAMVSWYGGVSKIIPFTGSWQSVALLLSNTFNSATNWQLHYGSSGNVNLTEFQIKDAVCYDLTAMFGATIADYVYSLETATAGAGVAWLKSHFPRIFNAGYVPYNAGELVSVQASAHKMTGFNQWDEEWEQGGLVDGNPSTDASRVRSKNYCECVANTAYYRHCGKGAGINIFWYDADKNYISYEAGTSTAVVTSPANARYFKICTTTAYGGTYLNDICINLHWDGERDGEYEPYEEHSYPLDSDVTLRGIPKLDANNNLYYDGDEYEADGTVTRKYGIVDLGTLTWAYSSVNQYMSVIITGIKQTVTGNEIVNMICPKYETIVYNNRSNVTTPCIDLRNQTDYIEIRNHGYTDAATFKAAMSGVYLLYELATPTTESADPYTEIQNVSNWGTEEFVSECLVPVGHETEYQPDLRAKIEVAPESPDTDGLYLMKRENGQNSYVAYLGELPSDPTTDGTYTLKCTVASGTATKTWEADE